MNDKQIKPHGRSDQTEFDQDDQNHPVPDRVEPEFQDDGVQDGHGQDNHGDGVEEAAHHDVDETDEDKERHLDLSLGDDPVGQLPVDPRIDQCERKDRRPCHDQQDHRRGLDGLRQDGLHARVPQFPVAAAHDNRNEGAHGCGLGGGHDPEVDSSQDEKNEAEDREGVQDDEHFFP